jgi:hypothetical protein
MKVHNEQDEDDDEHNKDDAQDVVVLVMTHVRKPVVGLSERFRLPHSALVIGPAAIMNNELKAADK